jgi:uncharacterized protein DUF4054
MATLSQMRGVGPNDAALQAADDAVLQVFLDEAALHVDAGAWSARYDTGHALLAAHLFTDGSRGATNSPIKGPIVAESLGPASRTYAQSLVKVQDDVLNLNGTTYGRRFLALRRTLVLTPSSAFRGGCG